MALGCRHLVAALPNEQLLKTVWATEAARSLAMLASRIYLIVEKQWGRPLNLTLMATNNPPHPGEFIILVYLDPNNLRGRELAGKLGVAASTLNRILTGTSRLSPDMALRSTKTDVLFACFS